MSFAQVTTSLIQAASQVLSTLADEARAGFEDSDAAEYFVVEAWALDANDPAVLRDSIRAALSYYTSLSVEYSDRIALFNQLLEYGGSRIEPFMRHLWQSTIFHMERAGDLVWSEYAELKRDVVIETGQTLPNSWGNWVEEIEFLMADIEQRLIAANPIFEHLCLSPDVTDLLDNALLAEMAREAANRSDNEPIEIPAEPFSAAATLSAFIHRQADRTASIHPRGYLDAVGRGIQLTDVFSPLRLVSAADAAYESDYTRFQVGTPRDQVLSARDGYADRRHLSERRGQTVNEVLNREKAVILLGEMGAGKSMLLRHLTYEHARVLLEDQDQSFQIEQRSGGNYTLNLARALPLYIELAKYIETRQEGQPLADWVLLHFAGELRDDGLIPLLDHLLATGQCLVMLDGLDAVVTDEQRRMLVNEVIEAGRYWVSVGNRVIVTCRIPTYSATPLPEPFEPYYLQPLDRAQINSLLLHWKLAIARFEMPSVDEEFALRSAHTETLALVREVISTPRLMEMARNPMMLRLLVQAYLPGGTLMTSRVALLRQVTDSLIREWRLPDRYQAEPVVLESEAEYLMSELAFWVHHSRPSGTLLERELRHILAYAWQQLHPEASDEQAEDAITSFLAHLRRHSGVLIEVDANRYGFAFNILKEYLAARYLISSYRLAPERIRRHLHDTHWQDVIRLAVGMAGARSRDDASDLIESAILARGLQVDQGDSVGVFEDYLYRDLFFAARLLGDDLDVRPEIGQYIVNKLLTLWTDGERTAKGRFSLLYTQAHELLMNLDETPTGRYAMQAIMNHISRGTEHEQAFSIDALTFWPSLRLQAREALVQFDYQAAPPLVRLASALAMRHAGELNRDAYARLLGLAADPDKRVSAAAQNTLQHADPVPYEALRLWVEYLHSGNAVRQRVSLNMLEQIGTLPPLVISELMALVDNSEPVVRQRTIDVLGTVSNLPDDALTALCRIISDDDPQVRVAAINALRRPVELPDEVISLLIRWTHDPNVNVRRASTLALGTCTNDTSEVLEALLERIDDIDSIREAVIEPLVIKGRDHPEVLNILAHIVRDHMAGIRIAIATALHHFTHPGPQIQGLLHVLLRDTDPEVRAATLRTVAAMENPGPQLIEDMISLTSVQNHIIASQAISSLAGLRNLPGEALVALVKALPVYWQTTGDEVLRCMQAHAPLPTDVVNEVMDHAVSRESSRPTPTRVSAGLRAVALRILGLAITEHAEVMHILLEAAVEAEASEVRIAAIRALSAARELTPTIRGRLLHLLQRSTLAVRCAGAITLGELVYRLPDPGFDYDDLMDISNHLAGLLEEITPRAAWEPDRELQDAVLQALDRVIARARRSMPRLGPRSEYSGGDLY